MMNLYYTACGLAIESEFEIPDLAAGPAHAPDVTIRLGTAPESLEQPKAEGVLYQVTPREFLLKVPRIARYWVHAGREVVIDRESGAPDDDVRVFLLSSALGALLHQRGLLPLHGSAIAGPRGAALFLGQSGCGKSTLAAEFRRRGYRVLADEVCAISPDANGAPRICPSYPRLRLWADAAGQLGQNLDGLLPVRSELGKYSLPLDDYSPGAQAISAVYGIHPGNTGELSVTPLEQAGKLREITSNVYRARFRRGMQTGESQFPLAAALAAETRVCRVVRPRLPYRLDDLATMLERDFA
jgi:hypothetical protein